MINTTEQYHITPEGTLDQKTAPIAEISSILKKAQKPSILGRTALLASTLFTALSILTGRADAADCPTEGPLVAGCPVPAGRDLKAASHFSRKYFVNKDSNPRYSEGDQDVQGVPNAQLIIESLEPIGWSDTTDIDLESRKIEKVGEVEKVSYFDRKSGQRRFVKDWTVMRVGFDGGDGLARLSNGSDKLEWTLKPGEMADKVWGPVAPEAREYRHQCNGSVECQLNCVQWAVVLRAKAGVVIDEANKAEKAFPQEYIHRDPTRQDKLSGLVDYIYYFDQAQGEPVLVDHSSINTPVQEGDAIWNKEGLSYKPTAKQKIIRSYNN